MMIHFSVHDGSGDGKLITHTCDVSAIHLEYNEWNNTAYINVNNTGQHIIPNDQYLALVKAITGQDTRLVVPNQMSED